MIGKQGGTLSGNKEEMQGIQAKLKMDNFSIATEDKNYYESMYKTKGIKQ